jgi:acyl-CoA hydrolase
VRQVDADEAARLVSAATVTDAAHEGDLRIVVSGNHATPSLVLNAVDQQLERYRLWALNAQSGLPDRDGVVLETCFVGPGMRRSRRLRYLPARLSLVPVLFRETLRPDVVIVNASRVIDGRLSLGTEVNVMCAAIEQCRAGGGLLVAQVNKHMPYTIGDGEYDADAFDLLVEGDQPLAHVARPAVDDTSQAIGERVAGRVPDGATLQLGIGAIPDASLPGVAKRRSLRVWSEMISDGVLTLLREGALDADEQVVTSFAFGSPELYEWIDCNPKVRLTRTETTNSPSLIAERPLMVSVNAALQVDLFGQANASRIHNRIYSGFGGQTDFIVGALHSQRGQALIALRSWHPKADASTIVPLVDEPVTSFQHSAVISEQGVADILGRSQEEQARNLIEHAAHPRAREGLYKAASALSLV